MEKRSCPTGFLVAVALVATVLVIACVFAFRTCSADARASRDPNAALGQIEGKSEDEIRAELDRVVEEGMFNISIAPYVEFADGKSEGELRIENVPGNRYLMRVRIVRDDTGEAVYESGLVEPNRHIQKAALDADLGPGEYACTAEFAALDPETEEQVGSAAAKITIMVAN